MSDDTTTDGLGPNDGLGSLDHWTDDELKAAGEIMRDPVNASLLLSEVRALIVKRIRQMRAADTADTSTAHWSTSGGHLHLCVRHRGESLEFSHSEAESLSTALQAMLSLRLGRIVGHKVPF